MTSTPSRGLCPLATALLLVGALTAAGCETYDPPPEVEILAPSGGQWFPETPLVLRFTEPVDTATLVFDVWPVSLDEEGNLRSDAVAVATGCTPSQGECGGMTMTLSDDKTTLTLDQGDTFRERLATPFFIEVAAGLSDLRGRPRRVPTRLVFQVDPPSTEGEVDVTLNSGVFTISADLGDILAGTFLRMIADMRVDPATGQTWLIATVAGKLKEAIPNTNDPREINPKIDGEGWVLELEAHLTPLPEEGAFFMETVPQDIDVKVLGVIRVRLQQLRLRATLRPGAGPDGRDAYIGVLSSAKVLLGDDGDDLGAVAAADWLGYGIFDSELTEERYQGLPRICEAAPCDILVANGGDCQLSLPWSPPAPCQ
ncbi:MAG: hypothetical protein H6744_18880 [Deltaproteobacteria bacterium]|nr:hypothetical protein [Deltaproteobacteria bacterium]MCB9788747.1 hypothetical protein [Deltaproteobacteria bacterium]